MTDLPLILSYLYRGARFPEDIELTSDGTGPHVAVWRLDAPQPTAAELEAALPAALAWWELRNDQMAGEAALTELYQAFGRAHANGLKDAQLSIQGDILIMQNFLLEVEHALANTQ